MFNGTAPRRQSPSTSSTSASASAKRRPYGRCVRGAALAAAVGAGVTLLAPLASAAPSAPTAVGVASAATGGGWEAFSDGTVRPFGGAAFDGDLHAQALNKPIAGVAATPDGGGYWLVASDGGVFEFGDARFYGSTGNVHLNEPVVGMAATPDGAGYWLVASDGGIFEFGDARFYGSTGNVHLNKPIVGMAATGDGKGYWLVASDGGIFDFGDAKFYGSTGNVDLNKPVVGMAATHDGGGYWLVASDGGVFNFGDAQFLGALQDGEQVTGLSPTGDGYTLVTALGAGQTFAGQRSLNRGQPSLTPGPSVRRPGAPVTLPVPPASSGDPLAGATFYAPGNTNPAWAMRQFPADAAQLQKIASHETAIWLTPTTANPEVTVDSTLTAAAATSSVPVFVLYAIPLRDCNGYSAGGESSPSSYEAFVQQAASGVKGRKAVFIVEPDALAMMNGCLSPADQSARTSMIKAAVTTLTANPSSYVYLDAGHEAWQPISVMAQDLTAAGVGMARGFSLNVSNFYTTANEDAYGDQLATALGKTFVVDTSRNGAGPDANYDWCNPAGRALGTAATGNTGDRHADAYLWIKTPGESDGSCNGGPTSGLWWESYAVGLAQRSSL